MRLRLKPSKHLRPAPARHRLTIIGGIHRGAEEGQVYRVDIPVEIDRDEYGEYLRIPDSAWRNYTRGEPIQIDYIEVAFRSRHE
jgi:hypothetical protein